MPKFTKDISQPGQYLASVPGGDGQRKVLDITPERQQGWVDQFYRMKQAGLRVPAPFVHRKDAAGLPVSEAELKNISSKDNGGWWEDFWVDKSTGKLMGRVDVPLPEDAERIGKTIVEVSPMVLPNHVDGMKRRWEEEALMHVAFVTHPVDKNQNNFITTEQDKEGVEMSQALTWVQSGFQMADDVTTVEPAKGAVPPPPPQIATEPTGGAFSSAVKILQDLGFQLPPDTNPGNFVERIVATGSQMLADKQKESQVGTTTQPGEGTTTQPTPVALAQDQAKHAISIATQSVQQNYTNRINALVRDGRTSQKFASENLLPLVNGFQLALDPSTGTPLPTALDTILLSLEAQPTPVASITGSIPGADGAQFALGQDGQFQQVTQEPPNAGPQQLEGKEFDEAVSSQISKAGLKSNPWAQ